MTSADSAWIRTQLHKGKSSAALPLRVVAKVGFRDSPSEPSGPSGHRVETLERLGRRSHLAVPSTRSWGQSLSLISTHAPHHSLTCTAHATCTCRLEADCPDRRSDEAASFRLHFVRTFRLGPVCHSAAALAHACRGIVHRTSCCARESPKPACLAPLARVRESCGPRSRPRR